MTVLASTRRLDRVPAIIPLVEAWLDASQARIAAENRIRAIEQGGFDPPAMLVKGLNLQAAIEHEYRLDIARAWRKHPLAPAVKEMRGVGEHSAAMLVSLLGGSVSTRDDGTPRSVRQLWAYCGHGDPARRRRKGMSQEEAFALGNPRAKSWTYLISTCMLKAGNREHYDAARAKYDAERSEWTPGHRHAAALRYQGKQMLLSLWLAERGVISDARS